MKNCTPLWREAHFEVVKVSKTVTYGRLLEVEMLKKCTPLWGEAHLEVKSGKKRWSRTTLEVERLKKCTPLWHESHVEVKMYKTHDVRMNFGS